MWEEESGLRMRANHAMYFYNNYYHKSALNSNSLLKLFVLYTIPGSYLQGILLDHTSLIPRPYGRSYRKWPESEATAVGL